MTVGAGDRLAPRRKAQRREPPRALSPQGLTFSAIVLLVATLWLPGCGADFRSSPPSPPSDDDVQAAALLDVYDLWVEIEGVFIPGRAEAVTLAADLEITFAGDPLLESGAAPGTSPTDDAAASTAAAGTAATSAAEATSGAGGTARVRLVGLLLDGAAAPLPETRAWEVEYAREEDLLRFEPLDPFEVGGVLDALRIEATLSEDGRRLEGSATLLVLGRAGTAAGVRQRNYLAATTDYSFGGTLARLRVRYDDQFTLFADVEDSWTDTLVRVESGSAFLINRFELILAPDDDNRHVEWLSPAQEYRTLFSFSAGDGANPQDLVLDARGRMWLSRYEPPYNDLLIADPRTGERLGRIDLTPWVSGAGLLPRPDQLLRHGDEIYATLQNANLAFSAYGPARLLVIDAAPEEPAAASVVASIELEGINPFQGMERDPASGLLYLAMGGIFPGQQPEQMSGGVEVVDPEARLSLGILVDDDDLGGHPNDVVIASPERGYVLASRRTGQDFLTDVVAFDPRDGTILGTVFSGGAGGRYQVVDLEVDGEGWLLLALRDPFDSGILILNAASGEPIPGGRLRTSLFTVSLATVRRAP